MRASTDFAAFYEREHPRVLGVLCAVSGDRQAAVDATDEAFVRALERWTRLAATASPSGWTYRVALNALRRSKRRDALEAKLLRRVPVVDVVPTRDSDVWEAVRSLPARQCQAISLRFVADLPEVDIATAMGITRGTVASTLADARARLALLLAEPALMEEA